VITASEPGEHSCSTAVGEVVNRRLTSGFPETASFGTLVHAQHSASRRNGSSGRRHLGRQIVWLLVMWCR